MEKPQLVKPDWMFNPKQVDIRDPHTKQIVERRAYTLMVHKGVRFYEYPQGSGNLWYEPDIEAGKLPVAAGRIVKGEITEGAPHVEWKAPVTEADIVHVELAKERQKSEAILKELEELKREKQFSAKVEDKVAAKVVAKMGEGK